MTLSLMLSVAGALLVLNLLPSAPPQRCACVPGSPTPAALTALQQGNAGFAADLPLLRKAVDAPDDDACGRRLWREAFILSASWEGNHEALRRYASAASRTSWSRLRARRPHASTIVWTGRKMPF